jgi:hypothetical protein
VNINSAFPSKYLKASDAEDDDLILTIKSWSIEKVGQEEKLVVYFSEQPKGMVLNKTNAKMIVKIANSEDTEEWKGTKIRIIATEVEFQGDLVMSLRVRDAKRKAERPAEPQKPSAAPDDSDIPF